MTTIADRIARYLLARLRRASIHRVYEDAAEAGLLETEFLDRKEQAGLIWRRAPATPFHLSGDEATDRDRIARLLRARSVPEDDGEIITLYEDEPPSVREGRLEQEAGAGEEDGGQGRRGSENSFVVDRTRCRASTVAGSGRTARRGRCRCGPAPGARLR